MKRQALPLALARGRLPCRGGHAERGSVARRRAQVLNRAGPEEDSMLPSNPPEERLISVSDILSEASAMGDAFVFEDSGDDEDVWEFEPRLSAEPDNTPAPAIRRALDPEVADVLSAYSSEQGFQEVSVEQLAAALAGGPASSAPAVLLDVRSAEEYSGGHAPSAVNVPLDQLSEAVREGRLDEFRGGRVAVICAGGQRSAQAAVRLSKVFHFSDVANVRGGTRAWVDAGNALEVP